MDDCNGHSHNEEYHYHATIDFPFFMDCYKARPVWSNQKQKVRQSATCPTNIVQGKRGKGVKRGKGKRPSFKKTAKVLQKSVRKIKNAIGPPTPPEYLLKAGEILGIDSSKLEQLLFPDDR